MKDVNANDLSNLTDPEQYVEQEYHQQVRPPGELPQLPAGAPPGSTGLLSALHHHGPPRWS